MEQFFDVKGAFGDGTANTDVVAFTADATPRNAAIPTAFIGQFVRITVTGTTLQYYFSTSPTAAIVAAVPAAAGQQAATLGEFVPADRTITVRVPALGQPSGSNKPIYLVWVCAGAGGGVFLTKSSGVPGLTLGDGR